MTTNQHYSDYSTYSMVFFCGLWLVYAKMHALLSPTITGKSNAGNLSYKNTEKTLQERKINQGTS